MWKIGRTRNAVWTQAAGEYFHSFSWVFLQLDRKQRICFLFLSKNTDEEKEKLLFFDHQDVNSLCLHHHYVNISYQFCVSIKLQKHNSWPISTHILLGLFSKCCYCTWYHRGFINNYSRKAIVFPADKTFLQLKFLIHVRRTSPQGGQTGRPNTPHTWSVCWQPSHTLYVKPLLYVKPVLE